MNAERLLANYERIADAPDAIARLRRFVLDLAVRGKLVPQEPNDEPAVEYLLGLSNLPTKTRKPLKPLDPSDCGGGLPEGWCWLPLGAIIRGMDAGWSPQCENDPRSNEEEWGVLKTTAVQALSFDAMQHKALPQKLEPRPQYQAEIGDILVTRAGPKNRVGVSCVVNVPCPKLMISDKLIRFHAMGGLSARYIALTLNAGYTFAQIEAAKSGMAVMQMNISQDKLRAVPIPLPPLAEQHRIVAKVDELMALCDRLEAARGSREAVRDRLAAASLARLNAPDPETFQADARFALDALPALTTRADQIKQLRQTILGLAVVGKLTASGSPAQSASIELDTVKERKEQLELRKLKEIGPISPDERWCELPDGWAWARWDHITDWITYGFTRPMPHTKDGVPIVTGKNVNQGRIVFETADRTPITSYRELNDKDRPKRGDILITKDGSIGRTAIVDTDEPFCINQSVAVLWLRSCHFDRRFLLLALDCPQTQQALLAKIEGVAIKHISIIDLGKMVFPVPPIAEQHRIIAKVDELMGLCDRLEASLAATAATRRRLLDALLAEALAPADARELEAAE